MRESDNQSGPSAEQDALTAGRVVDPPAGVTLVRSKQIVMGLRVDSDGLWTRTGSKKSWRIARPVAVKTKLVRSRVRLTLEDGSRLTLRPYLPTEKSLSDCGKKDNSSWTSLGDDDVFGLIVMIVMVIPSIYILFRALTGLSPRCKVAASLVAQIQATIGPTKS